jgi:hypothetical protein
MEETYTIISELQKSKDMLEGAIKANAKYIKELRDDITRWKEICWRQEEFIHKLYLIGAIQFLINAGFGIWFIIKALL